MRYWKRVNTQGKTTTIENYSHDLDIEGAVEVGEEEYNTFIASLPVTKPEPVRNLTAELDGLKARLEKLEEKSWLKKLLSKRHTK